MAWWQPASGPFRWGPVASVMLRMAIGEQYLPRAANAAYAAAIRVGETVLMPSVRDGSWSSGLPLAFRMPSFAGILYGSQSPIFFSRARKNVFTECQAPVTSVEGLPPSPPAEVCSRLPGSLADSSAPV